MVPQAEDFDNVLPLIENIILLSQASLNLDYYQDAKPTGWELEFDYKPWTHVCNLHHS